MFLFAFSLSQLIGMQLEFPRETIEALPWLVAVCIWVELVGYWALRVGLYIVGLNCVAYVIFHPLLESSLGGTVGQWLFLNAVFLAWVWVGYTMRPIFSYVEIGLFFVFGVWVAATGSISLGQTIVVSGIISLVSVAGLKLIARPVQSLPMAAAVALACMFEHWNYSY